MSPKSTGSGSMRMFLEMVKEKEIAKKSVSVSVDKRIIEPARCICKRLGIPFNVAINVFLYQLVYTKSIPFPIVLPSEEVMEQFDLYLKISEAMERGEKDGLIPGEEFFARIRKEFESKVEEDKNGG